MRLCSHEGMESMCGLIVSYHIGHIGVAKVRVKLDPKWDICGLMCKFK